MVEELLDDYVPEMARLVRALQEAARQQDRQQDRQASLDALHSLLGMSGEAGAQALYQQVRRIYVPLLEHDQWPTAQGWLADLHSLAVRTEAALKAYCDTESRQDAV